MGDTEAADLLDRWNGCGFYRMVGMRVERADEEGSAFRIGVTPDHTQLYGTAHGGVLAGLLDAAMALAILGRLPADEGCATIEMKINYTAPAPPGELSATGRVLTMGRRIAVAAAEARDAGGRVVCVAQGTFQRFAEGAR
jgi:acyl-CoA thioesterase